MSDSDTPYLDAILANYNELETLRKENERLRAMVESLQRQLLDIAVKRP